MCVEISCGVYAEGRQLKVTTAGVRVGLVEMLQAFISDINCDNDSLNQRLDFCREAKLCQKTEATNKKPIQ